jgi:uncharacterized protein DUF1996
MARMKGLAVLLSALAVVAAGTEVHAAAPSPSASAPTTAAPEDPVTDPAAPPEDPAAPPTEDPAAPPEDPGAPTEEPTAAEPTEDPGAGEETPAAPQGPVESDYISIREVPVNAPRARVGRTGSRGTFTSRCGRNTGGHYNPDNHIVAPGVRNGAHHIHDYVGNTTTDGFSTDETLRAGGTTCTNGDRSAYFWPVLRDRQREDTSDQAEQSAADGNVGAVLVPASVQLRFRGNPRQRVVAMPRFLRVITGDAKSLTNGPNNARAQWTCSGFSNRVTTKYPLCPRGSQVTRILDFPSCWDGRNLDSANHRTHIVFPDQAGTCPEGTQAVPQLRITLRYSVRSQALAFALDSFPEQLHGPNTDHADFHNVMPESLMRTAVSCINRGRNC